MRCDEKTSMSARCKSVAKENTPSGVTVVVHNPLESVVCFDENKIVVPKPKTNVALYIYLFACYAYKFWGSFVGRPRYDFKMAAHRWICVVMAEAGIEVSRKSIEHARRKVGYLVRQARQLGLTVDPATASFVRRPSNALARWSARRTEMFAHSRKVSIGASTSYYNAWT